MITAATSRSESIALAEVLSQLRFLPQMKGFIVPSMYYETKIHVNNEGAIKMVKKRFRSRYTRHIEIKHHIVRDGVNEKIIREEFVETGEQ